MRRLLHLLLLDETLAHHLVTVDSTNAVLILSPYRKRSRSDGILVVADVGVQLR